LEPVRACADAQAEARADPSHTLNRAAKIVTLAAGVLIVIAVLVFPQSD
jgi:hypothetical protein